jgi:hypothetical protein
MLYWKAIVHIGSQTIGSSVGLTVKTLAQILGGSRRRTDISTRTSTRSGSPRRPSVTTKPSTSSPSTPSSESSTYRSGVRVSETLFSSTGSTTESPTSSVPSRTFYGGIDDSIEELLGGPNPSSPPMDGDELCDGHQLHYIWKDGGWQ